MGEIIYEVRANYNKLDNKEENQKAQNLNF